MKVIFDVLAATDFSGGMRLHAQELLDAWVDLYPLDQVTIIGGTWIKDRYETRNNVETFCWPNEKILTRSIGQVFVTALLSALKRSDVAVSLSPIVSPFIPNARSVCFQHDWRHIKNPHEFPRIQRLYRKLWEVSARRSVVNVCISDKTQRETIEIVPGARTIKIENGGDHPRKWNAAEEERSQERRTRRKLVTFGHHNNKRPELVMQALAEVRSIQEHGDVQLVVLGARGVYREELRNLANQLNISEAVDFPGFVTNTQYQQLIMRAAAVILASSDEGYGLPVAEADYFGIPAVVTTDSGIAEIFFHAFVAEPNPCSMAASIVEVLDVDGNLPAGTLPTWAETAMQLRDTIKLRVA